MWARHEGRKEKEDRDIDGLCEERSRDILTTVEKVVERSWDVNTNGGEGSA